MTQRKFVINKIKKVDDGWNLYPVDNPSLPIFISNKYYSGKMPPFFRWPWEKIQVEVLFWGDFISLLKMNDKLVFNVGEEDYPDELKKLLEQVRLEQEERKKKNEATIAQIKVSFDDYLADFPINQNLEDDIQKMHLCLRAFLKFHFYKKYSHKIDAQDHLRRLSLLAILSSCAEKLLRRRYPLNGKDAALINPFSCFPFHLSDPELIEKEAHNLMYPTTFREFLEVEEMLSTSLPEIKDKRLKHYLNYVVCCLTFYLAKDYNTLCRGKNASYKSLYKEMILFKQSSLIFWEEPSEEDLENFMSTYTM